MKHIITLNNRYLSNWKEKVKPNGGIFVYDLEFTTNKDDARVVPFDYVHLLLVAIRNTVTPRGSTPDDGTVYYDVTTKVDKKYATHTKDNSVFASKRPLINTPYKPVVADNNPNAYNDTYNRYAKVEVNLDWLNNFMNDNNLTPVDMAIAFGYDGKRVYYGTKVLKGQVRLRYYNVIAFADKYPDIHGHWYFVKQGGN